MNVLKEILAWSADRPDWQRDALRRLVTRSELKDADIKELAEQCKASHGLAENVTSKSLTIQHLPAPAASTAPVSLTSLKHHSGVNALALEQAIAFGPGLTVVYGANAAGKSGYARILKRACRARGAEEILGNVFSGSAPGLPSATIKYKTNGADREHLWNDDNPPHRDLSRVSVFDRHCASVYVTEQTDVAYRPLGLDLFDKLSDACEAVRHLLEGERKELEGAAAHLPDVADGTKVQERLSRLTSLTKPEDIRELASLSDEEAAHLDDLRKRLRDLHSDNPQKTARTLEIRANRVESLVARIRTITELLSDAAVEEVFSVRDRLKQASQAAETMRRETFETQPLPNAGSDAWRAMWAAAERFSNEEAYPAESFPAIHARARCVLCQQQLGDDAIARFRRFRDFLSSEVQRERDQASAAHEQHRAALRDVTIIDNAIDELVDELQLEETDLAEASKAFLTATQHRRLAVMNALADESLSPSGLPALPVPPGLLAEYATNLRERVIELRGTDRSEKLKQIDQELRELEARQTLARYLNAVLGEIERKKRLAAYRECLDETKTTAITRKSTEITKTAVTEQLASSFKDELKALNFRHVEVEMVAAGGSRGALYHKLQLRRAPGVSVPKVVSEGESRCLSIASFFAELSTADDRSAILFDDPVSSLDDTWRRHVAERLVKEAKIRQVIVFTHDIVFLVALMEHAQQVGIDLQHQSLQRGFTVAGLCETGPPFDGMNVKARIGYLNDRLQAARKLHSDNKPTEYKVAGEHIYGHVRKTWERAVEEVLLYGVVERYRKSIQTQKVKRLHDITEDDCTALDAGMTKASKWEGGHDHAGAEGTQFPDPTEIEQDIRALDDWIKALRPRRP
jgi:hypothetical protein